jgi:hypothetical protein
MDIMIGYKGSENFDAGIIYAPYIPVVTKDLFLIAVAERMMVQFKKRKTKNDRNKFINYSPVINNRFFRDMFVRKYPEYFDKIRLWEILHGLPDRKSKKLLRDVV